MQGHNIFVHFNIQNLYVGTYNQNVRHTNNENHTF